MRLKPGILVSGMLFGALLWAADPAPAAAPAAPPLWETSAELTALITSGNSRNTTLGAGARVVHRPIPYSWRAGVNYLTSSNRGVKSAESFDALLRGERQLTVTAAVFAQTNYLTNVILGFNHRFNAEAGGSFNIIQTTDHSFRGELGGGANSENRTDGVSQTFAIARAGLDYVWKLSPTAEAGVNLSFLENLSNTIDWRLANTYSVSAMLNEMFSLKLAFRVDHMNLPVAGNLPTDTTTTASLVAKF